MARCRRPDRVREMVAAFTPDVLEGLPRDSDWLLTLQCVIEERWPSRTRARRGRRGPALAVRGPSRDQRGAVMFHGVTSDTLGRAAAVLGDHRRLNG